MIMGGYLCGNTSCKHCTKTHCGPNGSCVDCECKTYVQSSDYSEFC